MTRLIQRRDSILFDVEQSEAANQLDNAWRQRIALIDESLKTIDTDRAAISTEPSRPGILLPETPITDINVQTTTPSKVSFLINGQSFLFEEDIDWAERGTQLVRPELVFRSGEVASVVSPGLAGDRQNELLDHLAASLFVFATDLRNRGLSDLPLPNHPTLRDLAKPCDQCGGWLDWHGNCAECQRREWKRAELAAEAERLRTEREQIEEERARLADRLPIAQRRLAVVDAEIAALGD